MKTVSTNCQTAKSKSLFSISAERTQSPSHASARHQDTTAVPFPEKREEVPAGDSIGSKRKHKDLFTGITKPHSNSVDAATGCSASAASYQHVLDLTVTDRAISTLESLDKGGDLSCEELKEWILCLKNRCQFLARLYDNQDYIVLGNETLSLLKRYEGRQILTDSEFQTIREHLNAYGWVVSPRMWTMQEIIILCVILLDPRLFFNIILQKDRGKSGEHMQNRGMACLNNRVQKFMYSRLQSYGFIDTGHLPADVPAAVVLNSGGSYLQLTT